MREPLPGWAKIRDQMGGAQLDLGLLRIILTPIGKQILWSAILDSPALKRVGRANDTETARIAAEDAARAMVADMAAALGARTLIWADAQEGGE